jgi:hypothetical protein
LLPYKLIHKKDQSSLIGLFSLKSSLPDEALKIKKPTVAKAMVGDVDMTTLSSNQIWSDLKIILKDLVF